MSDKVYTTPLLQKLGIQEAGINLVVSAPNTFVEVLEKNNIQCLKLHSESLEFIEKSFDSSESADYVHLFTKSIDELNNVFPKLRRMLKKDGVFWISWPKKAAKVETDLTDLVVIKTGLKFGMVDIKVVSVDEVWSALKFVYRVIDR